MRLLLASAAALIAFSATLGALLGSTAIPAFAEDQPAQQNAQPKPESSTAPAAERSESQQPNAKSSGTNDQAGPSNAAPTANQDKQGDQAVHSVSGRGGKEEPGSHAPTQDTAVFVNGKLNVPGAPADSQTVPAKFSERNSAIDHTPIMGMSLGLSDEQKKAVVAGVKLANKPVQSTDATVAHELAWDITVHDLGPSANDPMLAKLKYVRTQDRVLLIDAPNRIVVGEIKG
jgi:hypothetical protein